MVKLQIRKIFGRASDSASAGFKPLVGYFNTNSKGVVMLYKLPLDFKGILAQRHLFIFQGKNSNEADFP